MKELLESWRQVLKEEESEKLPRVLCHCLCIDCIFNKNDHCYAKKIELDFATTAEGKTICECLTYQVGEGSEDE